MKNLISRHFRGLAISIGYIFLMICCIACEEQATPTLRLTDQRFDTDFPYQNPLDQKVTMTDQTILAEDQILAIDRSILAEDQSILAEDRSILVEDQSILVIDQSLPAIDQAIAMIDPRLNEVFIKATHNSYSGNLVGNRGAILNQLNQGIRFIEFDVHDESFAMFGDYRIGHDAPDDEVDHIGTNPQTTLLRDWLTLINQWSIDHRDHAPIIVLLDLKDSLTVHPNFNQGNLSRLNALLKEVFGNRLYRADAANAPQRPWPRVSTLRGKIITVLSGVLANRSAYYQDQGSSPSIAVNRNGQVIEVHDSGDGKLWYWSGKIVDQGNVQKIRWLDHGLYQNGKTPSVLIDDQGNLIEVHQSEAHTTLWGMTGKINQKGIVTWQAQAVRYDDGIKPTLGWDQGVIREIHQSQNRDIRFSRTANLVDGRLVWGNDNAQTNLPFFDKNTSGDYHVSTSGAQSTNLGILYWRKGNQALTRIRYEAIMFLEFQDQNPAELLSESHFFGATRNNLAFLQRYRNLGIVRLWQYIVPANPIPLEPFSQYAQIMATDEPYTEGYLTWMQNLGFTE
jgi:hypothetical protein